MEPGERIKQFRTSIPLNQTEFGEKLGFSQSFVGDIERGKVEPSRNFLKKLNEIFGLSSDYILHGESANWKRMALSLRDQGVPEEFITKIIGIIPSIVFKVGREEYNKGYQEGMMAAYKLKEMSEATGLLLESAAKILESEDEDIKKALMHNIRALSRALEIMENSNKRT